MIGLSKVNGKKVITADAFNVGEVTEVVMNRQSEINCIYVKLTNEAMREFGLRKPALGHLAICLPVDLVQRFTEVIILKASRKEFSVLAK